MYIAVLYKSKPVNCTLVNWLKHFRYCHFHQVIRFLTVSLKPVLKATGWSEGQVVKHSKLCVFSDILCSAPGCENLHNPEKLLFWRWFQFIFWMWADSASLLYKVYLATLIKSEKGSKSALASEVGGIHEELSKIKQENVWALFCRMSLFCFLFLSRSLYLLLPLCCLM